jgi:arginase family enzyme
VRNDERCGFARLTARDLDRYGVSGIVSRIRDRVAQGGPVYISVDIDVLDPAFAPGNQITPLFMLSSSSNPAPFPHLPSP